MPIEKIIVLIVHGDAYEHVVFVMFSKNLRTWDELTEPVFWRENGMNALQKLTACARAGTTSFRCRCRDSKKGEEMKFSIVHGE